MLILFTALTGILLSPLYKFAMDYSMLPNIEIVGKKQFITYYCKESLLVVLVAIIVTMISTLQSPEQYTFILILDIVLIASALAGSILLTILKR